MLLKDAVFQPEFGRFDRFAIGVLQLLVVLVLLLAGWSFDLHWPYYLGLLLASGFSLYQQYLIRGRDPQLSFRAFLNNHYFGMVVFAGIAVSYLIV